MFSEKNFVTCTIFLSDELIQPRLLLHPMGERIFIRCFSYSTPIWYKDGIPLNDRNKIDRDDNINIAYATELDTGNYTCNAKLHYYGRRFTATTEVFVGSK